MFLGRVETVEPGKLLVVLSLAEVESRASRQPRSPHVLRHGFMGRREPDHAVVGPVHLYVPRDLERLLAVVRDHLPLLQREHELDHDGAIVILAHSPILFLRTFRGRHRTFIPRVVRIVPRGERRLRGVVRSIRAVHR